MTHSYNDCTLQIIETYLKLISTEATEVHVINLKVGHCDTTQFSYGGSFLIFISRVPTAQQVQRQNTKLVVCAKICTSISIQRGKHIQVFTSLFLDMYQTRGLSGTSPQSIQKGILRPQPCMEKCVYIWHVYDHLINSCT